MNSSYVELKKNLAGLLDKSIGRVILIDWHYDGLNLLVYGLLEGKPFRAKVSPSHGVQLSRSVAPIAREYTSLDDRGYFGSIRELTGGRSDSKDCSSSQPCGNSCISKSRQCLLSLPLIKESKAFMSRFFGPAAPVERVSPAARKAAERHNSKIRSLSFEKAAIVGPDGQTLVSKKGGKDYVHFTPAEMQRMKGAVITHNHPVIDGCHKSPCANGLTFSPEDIGLAASTGAIEIQAVSPGYSHYLSPGPGGWDEKKFSDRYLPTLRKEQKSQISFARSYVRSGSKTIQEASLDAYHLAMVNTARKHRLDYRRVAVSRSAKQDERRFASRHGRSQPTIRLSRYGRKV